jgi:hypothetical protein
MSVTVEPATVEARVAEVFPTASHLIRDHGWLRGSYGDRGRGFCIDGAVMTAAYDLFGERGPGFVNRMATAARASLRRTLSHDLASVWNDRLGRTVGEVLVALEDARRDVLTHGAPS